MLNQLKRNCLYAFFKRTDFFYSITSVIDALMREVSYHGTDLVDGIRISKPITLFPGLSASLGTLRNLRVCRRIRRRNEGPLSTMT